MRNKLYPTIAFLMLIPFTLQACSVLPTTTATASLTTYLSPSLFNSTQKIALPTASPSPTPETETQPQIPSATPFLAPTDPPTETIGYVLNEYTASDGKFIYYTDRKNVYSMDLDGRSIHKADIRLFNNFIAVTVKGFYYTQFDQSYKFTDIEENSNQWCNSYNLLFYNTSTKKSQMVRKHLFRVTAQKNMIYMVDHIDHSNIICYDTKSKKIGKIYGLPKFKYQHSEVYITNIEGEIFVNTNEFPNKDYCITGNRIQTYIPYPTASPITNNANHTERILYDETTGRYSIWLNSKYKEIKYDTVDDIYDFGDRYIISTMNLDKLYQTGVLDIAIYMYSTRGDETKILEKSCEQISVSIKTEYINGWLFVFWDSGPEGGTADEIIIKHKIS